MSDIKKLYSFDLFDTLVCRSVKSPTTVFKLMELYLGIKYRNPIYKYFGFKFLRILSEKIARKRSSREEVTFDEIYVVLHWFIKNTEELKQAEIECELSVLHPIEANVQLLKKYIAEGSICCIASDMYLPQTVIETIVRKKLGVEIDIFVSSELMKTKHTGRMYEYLRQYYDISYENMLHHGDNQYADINIAKQLGINTFYFQNHNIQTDEKHLFALLKPIEAQKLADPFYELGFYAAAPCVWAVVHWMKKDLVDNGINKVFFGARDGYLFDEFFKSISDISSTYFRVSRRSLFLPTFAIDNSHNYLLFEGGSAIDAETFFRRLDCKCPKDLLNLDPEKNKDKFLNELKEQGFFERCQMELEHLLSYLELIGFKGDVGFFDLGWRGSLQSALQNIVKPSAQIKGYYFGLTEKDEYTPFYKGYYFYKDKYYNRKVLLLQSLAFFEYLFTEPTQSLKSVKVNDGKVSFDYLDEEESAESIENREKIMEGARDFLKIMKPIAENFNISEEDYYCSIDLQVKNYINNPSEKTVDVFTKIEHSATFGGSFTCHIIDKQPFSTNNYRTAFWRSGYVRSLKGVDRIKAEFYHSFLYRCGGIFIRHKLHNLLKGNKKQ